MGPQVAMLDELGDKTKIRALCPVCQEFEIAELFVWKMLYYLFNCRSCLQTFLMSYTKNSLIYVRNEVCYNEMFVFINFCNNNCVM